MGAVSGFTKNGTMSRVFSKLAPMGSVMAVMAAVISSGVVEVGQRLSSV